MSNDTPENFWSYKTAEQIAAEQGIRAPQPLHILTGAAADLWKSDDEFEQFFASIDRHPREATSA